MAMLACTLPVTYNNNSAYLPTWVKGIDILKRSTWLDTESYSSVVREFSNHYGKVLLHKLVFNSRKSPANFDSQLGNKLSGLIDLFPKLHRPDTEAPNPMQAIRLLNQRSPIYTKTLGNKVIKDCPELNTAIRHILFLIPQQMEYDFDFDFFTSGFVDSNNIILVPVTDSKRVSIIESTLFASPVYVAEEVEKVISNNGVEQAEVRQAWYTQIVLIHRALSFSSLTLNSMETA